MADRSGKSNKGPYQISKDRLTSQKHSSKGHFFTDIMGYFYHLNKIKKEKTSKKVSASKLDLGFGFQIPRPGFAQ